MKKKAIIFDNIQVFFPRIIIQLNFFH